MGDKSAETHAKFLAFLKASEEAVWFLARWFSVNHNRAVQIYPATKAKTHKEWKNHVDQGDLYMRPEGADRFMRYEVKRLGVDFSGPHDWPFKPKFIVCAKHSYDNASPPPSSYFILNRDMTCMAIARGSTHDKWTVEKRMDSRTNVAQEFYFCPMEHVIFHPVVDEEPF